MSSSCRNEPIRMGVSTDEPLRMEGLTGIFEDRPDEGYTSLSPVFGDLEELLSDSTLTYLIVGLNSFSSGVGTVEAICRRRPGMRLIVIGPEGSGRLIMDLIIAGARAYLDLKASPRIVRQAVEMVTSGSIWAPRRLLSQLIDHLLAASDTVSPTPPRLTDRERQVLDLILMARSNREIASHLGIEERTVVAHVGRLMRKTGVDNRINLLMRASNPALLQASGIRDRRLAGRRKALSFAPPPVTDK